MPLTDNLWLLLVAALTIGLICGWLIARLQAGQQLQKKIHTEQQEREKLLQQLARFEAQLEAEKQSSKEKLEFLDENRQRAEKNFQALSAQALAANNQSFLDLAKTTLGNFQQQAKGKTIVWLFLLVLLMKVA